MIRERKVHYALLWNATITLCGTTAKRIKVTHGKKEVTCKKCKRSIRGFQ